MEQNCFVSVFPLYSFENRFNMPWLGLPQDSAPLTDYTSTQDFSLLKHEQQNKNPRPIKLHFLSGVDFFPLPSILWDKKMLAERDAWMGHLGTFMLNDCPKNTESVEQQWGSMMQILIFPLLVKCNVKYCLFTFNHPVSHNDIW